MGRPTRLTYRGALHHTTLRCNNKEFLFDDAARGSFLKNLRESCERLNVPLFNFCLMTNHVHLLFQVPGEDTLPEFMHRVANVFAKRFNAARRRKGHLWEGRYVSTIVEAPSYFLRCMAYIDLNPVRARMVNAPGDYRWSGHRFLPAGDEAIIRIHEIYRALGSDNAKRYQNYLRLVAEEAARPPRSLAGVLFVGSKRFVARMQKRFGVLDVARPRTEVFDLGDGATKLSLRPGGDVPR